VPRCTRSRLRVEALRLRNSLVARLHATTALPSRRRAAPAHIRWVRIPSVEHIPRLCCHRVVYAIKGAIDSRATYQSDTSSDVPKPAAIALMGRYNTLHQLPRSIHRSAIQNELFYCGIYWAGLALSCQLHYTQ